MGKDGTNQHSSALLGAISPRKKGEGGEEEEEGGERKQRTKCAPPRPGVRGAEPRPSARHGRFLADILARRVYIRRLRAAGGTATWWRGLTAGSRAGITGGVGGGGKGGVSGGNGV